eukprot:TRINITY_DN46723_c1_g1_i1.p1 TRINITY_DN46723_c1_g1~~TRINITY_DN46723_c1_g1_i1.p1  ORF type:complete len:319 (-),score=26.24 TRINITY_DN46723_c1_g1_i1:36-965(-)
MGNQPSIELGAVWECGYPQESGVAFKSSIEVPASANPFSLACQTSKFKWLLIAGTTDPPARLKCVKKRDKNGGYLGGLANDLRAMEDWIHKNHPQHQLHNVLRDMRQLTVETVKEAIRSLVSALGERRPAVYYTGHATTNGDWCFADGVLTVNELCDLCDGKGLMVVADCCHAAAWLRQRQQRRPWPWPIEGKGTNMVGLNMIYEEKLFMLPPKDTERWFFACGPKETATDGVFTQWLLDDTHSLKLWGQHPWVSGVGVGNHIKGWGWVKESFQQGCTGLAFCWSGTSSLSAQNIPFLQQFNFHENKWA